MPADDDPGQSSPEKDPRGGHDPQALAEAEERMHAGGSEAKGANDAEADPEGDHDKAALEDAAKKMGADENAP